MFPCCSTRKDLSIDVSNTTAGPILTKLGRFQHFGTSQDSILAFYEKKNQIFNFTCCSYYSWRPSNDVWITTVGLDNDVARVISFLGVRTDGDGFFIFIIGNMAHKNFQLKAQNLELAVDRYMHPRMTGMHNNHFLTSLRQGIKSKTPTNVTSKLSVQNRLT